KWTSASHQHASRRHQCAIEEIAARNRLVQTKDLIEMRTPTHRNLPLTSFSRRRWECSQRTFPSLTFYYLRLIPYAFVVCRSWCTLFKIVVPVKQKGEERLDSWRRSYR